MRDFVKKAYEMVDDPSTDSIVSWGPDGSSFIVWRPLECKRDLLTKHLQIYSFAQFIAYVSFFFLVIKYIEKNKLSFLYW